MIEDKELSELKEEIEDYKRMVIKKETERDSILNRLRKEFGIKNISEAEKRIKKIRMELDSYPEEKEGLINIINVKLQKYREANL